MTATEEPKPGESLAATTERQTVSAYIEDLQSRKTRGIQRGMAASVVRKLSSWETRQAAKLHGTTLLLPIEKRKARRIVEETPHGELQLNLGSGPYRLDGWLNVDIIGMRPDLHWDLRRALPFPDGSAKAVFLEHVLEHIPLAGVMYVLGEARRVLRPGGVIRVGVPDLGRYMKSYAGDQSFVNELRPGRPTALLAVAEVAQFHGHVSAWDDETLVAVLEAAGFQDVENRAWGQSRLSPAPDTELRRAESVYAEGIAP
jgi:predicted SAM-dependent methyltransferase